ncbi:MAG TPA: hypothetical protein VHB21_03665 [Minicystis sp.]|nr:hypothetical protein [Minicystis sp.]
MSVALVAGAAALSSTPATAQVKCGHWFVTLDYADKDRRVSNTFYYCPHDAFSIYKAVRKALGGFSKGVGPNGPYDTRADAERYRANTTKILADQHVLGSTPAHVPDPLSD